MRTVLIATASEETARAIRGALGGEYRVFTAGDSAETLEIFLKKRPEFTFIDLDFIQSPSDDPLQALKPFWDASPSAEIIAMAPQARTRELITLVKNGVSNYLTYPLDPEEAAYVLHSLKESALMLSELDYLREESWNREDKDLVATNSPLMKEVFKRVRLVAPTNATVLLTGESGTGKSLIARIIHRYSNRRDNQFLAAHCGAIPDSLIESELFGHEKGAFTGAVRRKLGRFEVAHGGTIFLDEIGTLSALTQIKLLEVIQEKVFTRVGGESPIRADVRIVAATNSDLKKMVDQEAFRADLYYRLNVFPIQIPPLRERPEDIPLLAGIFINTFNRQNAKSIAGMAPGVVEALSSYSWPGNIRELENLIERAHILETGRFLSPQSFPAEIFAFSGSADTSDSPDGLTLAEARRRGVEEIERRYLRELMVANKGRIDRSARQAGVSTRQLHNLLTRYSIHKEDFR